ncbi:MAG: type IV pilus secretin PilQ [Gammaproteobacteria bacterium]|nr:MAG: type IV pilus secretin PilQ [Gammaproteobacteria bacterium]TLZ01692.1 MAG: type IV pilus secretin PilQ [Gammaproteobacteria bacterium]TLZ40426.1 MAG: type IV pilus secretin PilQ [Gammaproteobacteria bacterium]
MNRLLGTAPRLVLAGVLGTFAGTAWAADQPALQAIDVQPLPGQQLQITLRLSGPAPQPLSFTIDNPARISFDLPNTTLALASRRIDVHASGLDTILAAETKGRTRLVLNLDKLVPYDTRVDGNNIIVMLGGSAARASAGAAPSGAVAAGGGGGVRELRAIDFRRSTDGAGRVIVRLSDPHMHVNLHQIGDQVVVDFSDASVPANLMRRYDASDFGTPIRGFDVTRVGNGSRISITASGDYEQLAYQSDDQYVVEIAPRRKAANAQEERPVYTGERLTLNFQDIETRAVLQLLADASGQNIVVSDSVSGNVTLRLQNVPWDQALDIVLRTKGLDKRRQDNVIIVAPQAELASREKAELAARKDVQELAPLRSEYLQVNYAKAQDMAALIKTQTNSLLSTRGSVAVDDRTNTLLLQDTADRLADVRRLVATLDIPVRQVLIEARIVIVNNDFERSLGARFGLSNYQKYGSTGLVTTSGTAAGTDQAIGSALTNLAGSPPGNPTIYPISVPTGSAASNRYNVNLPVTSAAGTIALGILGNNFIVDLELSAAQAETQANIISSPRVITANQKEAIIEQGVEIPYQQSASSGATTIQFKKAVLSLKVKPQITPDNRIILDLDVKDDAVGTVVVTSGGVNVPSIDTREITTQVLVNDGQTVVLGGILSTTQREDDTKVPYLGDIPVLGHLFKNTIHKDDKDELMIFITPKIVREGVNVYN